MATERHRLQSHAAQRARHLGDHAARRGDGVVPGVDRAPPSTTLRELAGVRRHRRRCSSSASAARARGSDSARSVSSRRCGCSPYALILLGSPSAGVGVALLGATINAMAQMTTVSGVVRQVGGTAISLSTAGMMLLAMGVHGSITQDETVPWDWGLAIVLAGMSIVGAQRRCRRDLDVGAAQDLVPGAAAPRPRGAAHRRRGVDLAGADLGDRHRLQPRARSPAGDHVDPRVPVDTAGARAGPRGPPRFAHRTRSTDGRSWTSCNDALVDPRAATPSRSVLLMDLNGFKEINDRLGHEIGDALLVAFADRLETQPAAGDRRGPARRRRVRGAACRPGPTRRRDGAGDRRPCTTRSPRRSTSRASRVTIGVSIGVASAPDDGRTSDRPAPRRRRGDVQGEALRITDRVLRQLRQDTTARPPQPAQRAQRRAHRSSTAHPLPAPAADGRTARSTRSRR